MKDVRLGFIGTGPRAQGLISVCQKVKGCRIVALCERIEALLQKAYKIAQDPDMKCYTDHRKMLEEADIDAVFIAAAPENNADLVCEVLEAGKHVMCEVPLAYTIEDCWKIVLAVEKSGLKFQLAEQTQYWPFIQTWKKMVKENRLGKIIFVEGQYLHGMGQDRYWYDSKTGERLTIEQAKNNPTAKKSRLWNMPHPILYLPHELSPILSVLDDRVEKVTCMGTRRQSYYYEWFPVSDIEIALMHTKKDTILRLAAGFIVPTTVPHHWYHFIGTKGRVETNRYNTDKMKMWLPGEYMNDPAEVNWQYSAYNTPAEALKSGHGGGDYWPIYYFIDSILNDTMPPMDVYKAVETAAPAIMAAKSLEEENKCLSVPDFRPGPHRTSGQPPTEKRKAK